MKKTLLCLMMLVLAGLSAITAKTCGCIDGNTSYAWSVPDGSRCSDASVAIGTATETIDHGSYVTRREVKVQVAIDFCG